VRLELAQRASARLARARADSRIVRVLHEAVFGYVARRCPQFAASISYHVLLSLFPVALLVATIGGVLLQNDARRAQVADAISERVPLLEEAGVNLDAALSTSLGSLGVLGLIGLVTLLWSASGMMASLRIGLNAAWGFERAQPFIRGKLIDMVLVVLVNAFLIFSVGLVLLQPLFPPPWSSWITTGILGTAIGWFAALAVLYRVVPVVRPRGPEILAAAALAAMGVTLLQNGFSLYADRFADYSAVYGSLATVVAFLILVYLGASVILFCGALAGAWRDTGAGLSADASADEREVRTPQP
jgi:membrane protein